MSTRYDLCQAQERGGKTYWHKIGTLWKSDDGKMSVSFDSLPIASLNRDGKIETRAMVFEAKARDGGGGNSRSNEPPQDDDNILF
jgi:hypothetical protein